jgi:hypothetical protein
MCEASSILTYLSFSRETDASIQGIRAMLSQSQKDEETHPVAFPSQTLSPAEMWYSITVMVRAISYFRI